VSDNGAGVRRDDVVFHSGGERCAGWLYTPAGPGPHPAVVMAHGFAATREAGLDRIARRFAAAGFCALAFDYRHFGASGGMPRQVLDIASQLEDCAAALAYVRALPEVDPARIALWGSSFGGGHAFTIAARDHRLAACIAQIPFVDGLVSLRITSPSEALRLTAAAFRDACRSLRGRAPYTVPVVGPPGSTAALTTPDAEPGYYALLEPDAAWPNRVAARIFLSLLWYRPGRSTPGIRCPLLVCVADDDEIAPAASALRAAARAPDHEVRRYPGGHFDIYQGPVFEREIGDQVDFLRRHLENRDEGERREPGERRERRAADRPL
jgi:dienelactone hydrolase